MLKLSDKKIIDTITKKYKTSPSGSECTFVKINNKYGIKLYNDKDIRNITYEWQKRAAKAGLGPEVYGKVDFEDSEITCCPRFGYITEVVKTLIDTTLKQTDRRLYYKTRDKIEQSDKYIKEFSELQTSLEEIGFCSEDLFIDNIGRKNSKMICIDFGYQYYEEYNPDTDEYVVRKI